MLRMRRTLPISASLKSRLIVSGIATAGAASAGTAGTTAGVSGGVAAGTAFVATGAGAAAVTAVSEDVVDVFSAKAF